MKPARRFEKICERVEQLEAACRPPSRLKDLKPRLKAMRQAAHGVLDAGHGLYGKEMADLMRMLVSRRFEDRREREVAGILRFGGVSCGLSILVSRYTTPAWEALLLGRSNDRRWHQWVQPRLKDPEACVRMTVTTLENIPYLGGALDPEAGREFAQYNPAMYVLGQMPSDMFFGWGAFRPLEGRRPASVRAMLQEAAQQWGAASKVPMTLPSMLPILYRATSVSGLLWLTLEDTTAAWQYLQDRRYRERMLQAFGAVIAEMNRS